MEVDNDEKDIFDQEFPYWDAHMILNGTYGASSIPIYYSIPCQQDEFYDVIYFTIKQQSLYFEYIEMH